MVDQFSRECVAIWGKPRLNGSDVAEALDMAVRERDKATSITLDNGSEFTGKVMNAWADSRAVQLGFIRPGKPTENAFHRELQWKAQGRLLEHRDIPIDA